MDSSSVLSSLLVCSLLYYALVQFGLVLGILRLKKTDAAAQPFVSVVVAARNEERTIEPLLASLLDQSYPHYEIIIVDDRSTDSTSAVVAAHQKSDSRLKLVTVASNSSDLPPKKNALTKGIRSSCGEILLFTDADCIPSKNWIAALVSQFDDTVGVVAGYSPYDANLIVSGRSGKPLQNFLHRFVRGEEFKGAIWSAGSIGLNRAWLCTGRNLAYRRRVFDEVGGFEKIKMSISGDDDLFIQIVRHTTKWKIRYAVKPDSFVRTAPPVTFSEFVQQRTRHFSAGKFFSTPMKAFFFFFHLSNLILLLGLTTMILSTQLYQLALLGFAIKLACDLLVNWAAIRVILNMEIRKGFNFSDFLLTEILYILYNTFIGPLGFVKTFRWKPE